MYALIIFMDSRYVHISCYDLFDISQLCMTAVPGWYGQTDGRGQTDGYFVLLYIASRE